MKPNIKQITVGTLLTFAFSLAIVLYPVDARPQAKVARVGYMSSGNAETSGPFLKVFTEALRSHGWVEGQNLKIEYLFTEGRLDRFPSFAAEMVNRKVNVIFAPNTATTLAFKQATNTIPVVFMVYADPVGLGLVASMAHPGGNMTGLSVISDEISAKRLEILKDAFPKVSRVAVLYHHTHVSSMAQLKETQRGAKLLGIELLLFEAQGPEEFEPAFAAMTKAHADALIVIENPNNFTHRKRLIELAAKFGRPTMYGVQPFVEDGGLMSYSVNYLDQLRRAADYVDKILKGAKPGDLPVEEPTRLELLINLKTAKALGLTIPQSILLRADKVIQ